MEVAIDKLKDAEVVLMNKIKRMKDGKPKYDAADQLRQIREAIDILHKLDSNIAKLISTQKDTVY